MNDLINEQDFVKPVKYNPWKWFITCYGILFVLVAVQTYSRYIIPYSSKWYSFYRVSMMFVASGIIIAPFIMVFGKKDTIYHTNYPTLVTSIAIMLFNSWFFIVLHRNIYEAIKLNDFSLLLPGYFFRRLDFTGLLFLMAYGAVSFIIIFFIVRHKRKKASKTFKAHN
ncbi:hypothetical protein GN157_00765 [Flavobacterium rakeshii]|uniref:Uncharacterized protein n=1 Tax=Flavobacterium rakeshii TaxID=1038845 RepID=A0A6N8H6J0_9FLAO|nr:hypothetical protein [Flavobacterium rakeshii]MUV02229.1 hypothetical protein [Flavobacterium rakeshii]